MVFTKNYLDTDILSTGNNWVIKYRATSATAPSYSRISFADYPSLFFDIDPDPSGNFSFDFKNIVGDLVNTENFNDPHNDVNIVTDGTSVYNESNSYKRLDVVVAIFFPVAGGQPPEVQQQDYRFKLSVLDEEAYELGFKNIDSVFDVLLPEVSEEFYTQGTDTQPLDFSLYSQSDSIVQLFNETNGTNKNIDVTEGINRVFLQDGRGNEIGVLILDEGLNRIRVTSVLDSLNPRYINITIKGGSCCSVLKWLNLEGGFGYHVFQHKTEDYSSKTKGFIESDYNTFDDYTPNAVSTGADMIKLIGFTSIRVSANEIPSLQGLISSPKVYQLLSKSDGAPLWKERVFNEGEMRIKQTGKRVFDFEINTLQTKKGYTL